MAKKNNKGYITIQELYLHYKERIENVALTQFEWHNLPDTVDRWYMERTLLYNGSVAFYYAKDLQGWMATNYTWKGLTPYGYPADIKGVATASWDGKTSHNGTFDVEGDKWEICFDNMTHGSLWKTIDTYARQLARIHMTINNNLMQQYRPYLVVTDNQSPQLKKTMDAFFDEASTFAENMLIGFDPDTIKTLSTNVPYLVNDLQQAFENTWRRCMSELGVTGGTSKRERMLNEELVMNRQEDEIKLNSRLMNRVELCNKLNKRFGLNISVNLSATDLGVNDYGKLYPDYQRDIEDGVSIESTTYNRDSERYRI